MKTTGNRQRLRELNRFDIERILHENIYELEEDNKEIIETTNNMINQDLNESLIRKKIIEVEDNAAESIHLTKMVQHEIDTSQFNRASIFRGR